MQDAWVNAYPGSGTFCQSSQIMSYTPWWAYCDMNTRQHRCARRYLIRAAIPQAATAPA